MEKTTEDVVIVGGGIAGLATAVALKKVGIRALVLERSQDIRATGAALTLFPNAWLALDALGVSHKLNSVYAPLERGFVTNVVTGAIQQVYYTGTNGVVAGPRSIHRKSLLKALADELPIETIRFSSKVSAIDTETQQGSSIAIIHLSDGTTIKSKILIGCDGLHSEVGRWLGLAAPVDSGRAAVRGLAVFPEGHGLNHEVQQVVDVGIRAGFIPLNDKDVYWFMNYTPPPQGDNMAGHGKPDLIQKEVLENYAKDFPPQYLDIIRHCDLSTLTWAPLMFRKPWNVMFGDLSKGNVTVAGDAMHPMTPDLGQGGCSALEDAVALGRHIGNSLIKNKSLVPRDIPRTLDGYVKERRGRVTWLVAGSFISGWVQLGGSQWWMKFLRDVVFYKFLFRWFFSASSYDCGKLPSVSFSGELDNSRKLD